jgi:hypothetical protein
MIPLIGSARTYLIVIGGESNSGGLGFNSDIPASELLPNQQTLIWHNVTGGFEPLDIGTNNLLGHTDLTGVSSIETTRHGLERSLALDAQKQIRILKTGQGGSRISQWLPADSSGYWNTFVSRYEAAISNLGNDGRRNVAPLYVWWQGVNDANDGNTGSTWRTATQAHFARVRQVMGANTHIFPLKIMPNTANKIQINLRIDEIGAADPLTHIVDVSGADGMVQSDLNHWSAEGFRVAGQSLTASIFEVFGSRVGVRP